jgi:hypothetical protein
MHTYMQAQKHVCINIYTYHIMQRPHEALWPVLAAINEPMAAKDLEPATYKVDQNKINAALDLLSSFEKTPSCVVPNQVTAAS